MREKRKEKKTVIDGEPKTEKKHALPSQVGTTEKIPLPPWKPPFGHTCCHKISRAPSLII